jgi:hypothetical protein
MLWRPYSALYRGWSTGTTTHVLHTTVLHWGATLRLWRLLVLVLLLRWSALLWWGSVPWHTTSGCWHAIRWRLLETPRC